MTSVSEIDLLCAGFSASATVAVNVAVPLAEEVPVMIPVDGSRLNPAGRAPAVIDHVYGAVPPLACSWVEKANPTVVESEVAELIVRGGIVTGAAVTGRETVVVADCTDELESVTVMPKE
jgi:hypothetical protein